MPQPYPPSRPACRSVAPALSAIADALSEHIDDVGVRAAAQLIGQPKSTVHGWGANLNSWDACSLLALAARVPSIAEPITALLAGAAQSEPEPTAAIGGSYEAVKHASGLIAEIVEAVRDGKYSRTEAARVLAEMDELAAMLPKLRRDVKAAAGR